MTNNSNSFPYECDLEISFPTKEHAHIVKSAMEVDEEIGDRIKKTFSIAKSSTTDEPVVMGVQFQATEAKMLRVAVSTFYDYLTVTLKCFQEFEERPDQAATSMIMAE
mmetsp:Transcript_3033/g.3653  ORF Transcript_3033/g.3653 Transcript_3033/m.3653 type:complete len:108 (-) Transcript_3033:993-1316(-)